MTEPQFVRPLKRKAEKQREGETSSTTEETNSKTSTIQKRKKKSKKTQEIEKRKLNWLDHQTQIKKKAKKLPIASFTHRKKESIFKTTDSLEGKVGVTNSGRKMTQISDKNARKQWSNLLKPSSSSTPSSNTPTHISRPNNEDINKFLSQFQPSNNLDYN